MKLHRHDELVEAMARAFCIARGRDPDTLHQLYDNEYPVDATDEKGRKYYKAWRLSAKPSTAALDALLEAAVRLEVGKVEQADPDWGSRLHTVLALRMEASDE